MSLGQTQPLNKNEYQESSWGYRAADRPARKSWQPYRHLWSDCLQKIWEPRRLTTLRAFTACYRDSFTFLLQNEGGKDVACFALLIMWNVYQVCEISKNVCFFIPCGFLLCSRLSPLVLLCFCFFCGSWGAQSVQRESTVSTVRNRASISGRGKVLLYSRVSGSFLGRVRPSV
jgi:hypothetical protein